SLGGRTPDMHSFACGNSEEIGKCDCHVWRAIRDGCRARKMLCLVVTLLYGLGGDLVAAERFERRPEDRERYSHTLGQREGKARSEWQPGERAAPGDFVFGGSNSQQPQEEEKEQRETLGLRGSRGNGRMQNSIQERPAQGDLP
ncbi:hypothetical protein, partial [Candidatus Magnetaquicoccus inordinatus]|uniref:hypothetical protein n=1 Tax=Candidatus Magnetaquicoccus inordinatus TaxID=2496818 RepID=UPI001D0F2ED1